MRDVLKMAGLAAVMALSASAGSGSAAAQGFDIRIGDRPRVIERRDDYRDYRGPRVIERRVIRPAPRRTVCRTEMRETVRPNGVVVRRPTEVCRTRGY